METFGIPDISVDIFNTLKLLRPFDINIASKKIGPLRDGGYVFADNIKNHDLLSFGISNDVRFERVMAENGHTCYMYDHTIDNLPEAHAKFDFRRVGVCGSMNEDPHLLSIKDHLSQIRTSDQLLLKIDVEGAEWDVFSTIDDETLSRFDQIVGEFHWFLELENTNFCDKVNKSLTKLISQFTLFNVHANNCRPLGFVGGFPVADVLELSFVKSSLVNPSANTRLFPGRPDKANNLAVTDHPLLFFPFLPEIPLMNAEALITRLWEERHSE